MRVTSSRSIFALATLLAAVAACGGGGGDTSSKPQSGSPSTPAPSPFDPSPSPSPSPAPAPAPGPAPAPVPTDARVLYFSDCQTGAAASCVPGSNGNAGNSPGAPRRDLSGIDVDRLAAGTQLLFARGGSWNWSLLRIDNAYVTPAEPLVIADYGSGARPLLLVTGESAIHFGTYGNTTNDGGYIIRNLKMDGQSVSPEAVFLRENVHDVTIEGVEITGFAFAIHSQTGSPYGVTSFTLRNSRIVNNADMGILGSFRSALVENNDFEGNNRSGSTFNHAIYLGNMGNSGMAGNTVIRNNRLVRNSTVNGVCTGGNITSHGQWDGVTIEGNLILQDAAVGGCYGISATPGYSTAESMRNYVVRNNTIINVGNCAVCAGAAPGITVEDNRIINLRSTYQVGVLVPAGDRDSSDAVDAGAIVRNNLMCFATLQFGSLGVRVSGDGAQVLGNTLLSGADALAGLCAL